VEEQPQNAINTNPLSELAPVCLPQLRHCTHASKCWQ